ncbi:MAG TPA: hypothetical protein VK709_00745 [Candidatus Saccharimonadales bacterium]|jgi:hypothetical protein|nr:hypothetical protein [Candidatus Saccharimonadales bacterium]
MRAIRIDPWVKRALMVVGLPALAFGIAAAQSGGPTSGGTAKSATAAAVDTATQPDVAKTLKAASEALGLARWSGVGGQRLPEVDVINTMEFWGSGTTYSPAPSSKPGEPWQGFTTEYHASIGYNPPAMRVELTRTPGVPAKTGAAPLRTIEVVRESFAWDESEVGGGLVAGKGTASPALTAVKKRLLQLWILPYGVLKAAWAAGDKTKISTEQGATVLTFPLNGELAGVIVKATLDPQYEIAKVETKTENPALADLVTETEYSDYADHGEIATDVKSPGHIVRKQGAHPELDLHVKILDANNPYLVFPVPENVKKSAAH